MTSTVAASSYRVTGMTCDHCRSAVITEVSRVAGVRSVTVDLAAGVLTVDGDATADRVAIAAAVDEAGCTLEP